MTSQRLIHIGRRLLSGENATKVDGSTNAACHCKLDITGHHPGSPDAWQPCRLASLDLGPWALGRQEISSVRATAW